MRHEVTHSLPVQVTTEVSFPGHMGTCATVDRLRFNIHSHEILMHTWTLGADESHSTATHIPPPWHSSSLFSLYITVCT